MWDCQEKPIGDSAGQCGDTTLFNCKPCHGYIATTNSLFEDERFRFDGASYKHPPGKPVGKLLLTFIYICIASTLQNIFILSVKRNNFLMLNQLDVEVV